MTAATELPREVGENYIRVFERLGAEKVRIVDTESREDASSSTALEAIAKATGIFFTGGDQARITSILKGTEIDTAIHQRFAEGAVIAGTSAGAAVMPDKMIVEGDSETNTKAMAILNVPEQQQGHPHIGSGTIKNNPFKINKIPTPASASATKSSGRETTIIEADMTTIAICSMTDA